MKMASVSILSSPIPSSLVAFIISVMISEGSAALPPFILQRAFRIISVDTPGAGPATGETSTR